MNFLNKSKYTILVNVISISVAFTINFLELVDLFTPDKSHTYFPSLFWWQILSEIVFTYISIIVLFFVNEKIFRFNDACVYIGWKKVIYSFIISLLINSLLGSIFVFLHNYCNIPAIDTMEHIYSHPLRDFLIAGIVTISGYLLNQNLRSRKVAFENQQLKIENISVQFEALKSQLNPHMLFNSLNTLYSLIRESQDRAQNYLNELSKVMRYMLQQDDESYSISLREEMNFVASYVYLLKMRYEDNLMFSFDIEDVCMQKFVPRMAVQLLIENAVKHNEISKRHPLHIEINSVASGFIEVTNKIQLRRGTINSTGIGLDNLSKRYKLLYKKDIQVMEVNGSFTVVIPLV